MNEPMIFSNPELSKGDRVELTPVKEGVKIIHIKREEVKPK